MKNLILIFATVALAAASAATYDINIPNPVSCGDKSLAAGQYTVDVQGERAVFKKGKETVELPVTVELSAAKARGTQVNASGSQLREIFVGGTKVKLVFKTDAHGASAGGGAK